MFARVLTVALALLAVVAAQQPDKCGEDFSGSEIGRVVKLVDVPMPAGVRDPPLPPINPANCPPSTVHQGTRLRACDFDVKPYVKLESLSTGNIHRNGDLARPGQIYTSIFCAASNL